MADEQPTTTTGQTLTPEETARYIELSQEYERLAHAIQTGVGIEQGWNSAIRDPKHLRVGINTSKCDQAALVRLLIKKGLFTELEYVEELVEELRREVDRTQQRLQAHLGPNTAKVTLV